MKIMDVVIKYHNEIDYEAYKTCKSKHHSANNCIECCQKPYFDEVEIDYSCPQKRKLYVVRYAPAYSKEIYSALTLTPRSHRNEIFQKPELKVVSIGGGPGTDIAAFNKWLSTRIDEDDEVRSIQFLRIDIEDGWRDISRDIIHLHKLKHIDYSFKYAILDFSSDSLKSATTEKADIVIMSYVISEIQDNSISLFIDNLREILSDGTLIIINDRPQAEVMSRIESILKGIGCEKEDIAESSDKAHCGDNYPDEIYHKAAVTVYCKSLRINAVATR